MLLACLAAADATTSAPSALPSPLPSPLPTALPTPHLRGNATSAATAAPRCSWRRPLACLAAATPLPTPLPTALPTPHLRGSATSAATAAPRCSWDLVKNTRCYEEHKIGDDLVEADARAQCEANDRCDGYMREGEVDGTMHYRLCNVKGEKDGCGRVRIEYDDEALVHVAEREHPAVVTCRPYDATPPWRDPVAFVLCVIAVVGHCYLFRIFFHKAERAIFYCDCSPNHKHWIRMILWLFVATAGLLCLAVSRGPTAAGDRDGCSREAGEAGVALLAIAGALLLTCVAPLHSHHRSRDEARRREREEARAREEERRRPKYERLSVAREPGTDPALVEALTKPEDVERELERFRVWQRAADGSCPRCGGLGAYGVCDGAKGDREGHLPCGCEICHLCHGSGTTDAVLEELEPGERDDEMPCQVCFCERPRPASRATFDTRRPGRREPLQARGGLRPLLLRRLHPRVARRDDGHGPVPGLLPRVPRGRARRRGAPAGGPGQNHGRDAHVPPAAPRLRQVLPVPLHAPGLHCRAAKESEIPNFKAS